MNYEMDYDGPVLKVRGKVKTHVARKLYKCTLCGGEIKPGDKYQYRFSMWDDGPYQERWCSRITEDHYLRGIS